MRKKKKKIYCAIPTKMRDMADDISRFVIVSGHIPVNPFHALPHELFEGGKIGREDILQVSRDLVFISDEIWVFGLSENVEGDIKVYDRPVTYFRRREAVAKFISTDKPSWVECDRDNCPDYRRYNAS